VSLYIFKSSITPTLQELEAHQQDACKVGILL